MDNQIYRKHISQVFNKELEALRSMLMEMGGLVEAQLRNSVQALIEGDSDLALKLKPVERRVNDIEMAIDRECTRILALRQPTASDLRMVLAISRATKDMERIGDESIRIAKVAVQLAEEGHKVKGSSEVRNLAQHVASVLNLTLDAFARFDTELALNMLRENWSVDQEYETAARSLVTFMMEDPQQITKLLNVMWVLRALERIADHTTNIAEHLIYLVDGRDIRHLSMEQLEQLRQ